MNNLTFTNKTLIFTLDSNLIDLIEEFYKYVDYVKTKLNQFVGIDMDIEKFQKCITNLFDIVAKFENIAWFQEMQYTKNEIAIENLALIDQLKAIL